MENIRTTARIAERLSDKRRQIRYKTFNGSLLYCIKGEANILSKPVVSTSTFMQDMAASMGLTYVDLRVHPKPYGTVIPR